MLAGIGTDLRYVLRTLRRSPGFTLVAVVSLAIGIGANTAMFGVVRTLLLTPMPVAAPHELSLVAWDRKGDVSISQMGSADYRDPDTGARYASNFSYPLYRALRSNTPRGVGLFAFAFLRGVSVAADDRPAFLAGGALADGRYFSTLGIQMQLGRPLSDADDVPGAPVVAVISHAFWMRAFGGDPGVVGRTVRVNGTPTEVVGVTAEGFKGLSMGGFFPQTEITLPLASQPEVYARMSPDASLFTSDDVFWLRLMVRVPRSTSRAAVEQALTATMRATPSPLVGGDGHLPVVRLLPGARGAQTLSASTAKLLYILMGVVGIVLLIACANLASLMLARGVGRQREMAVRRALGGGRARLIRQTLLESLVLAGAGTVAGVLLTVGARPLLAGILRGSLGSTVFGNEQLAVRFDPVMLSVSAALGIATTVLFGLLPALRLSGLDPMGWLKDRASTAAPPRLGVGRGLIALQVAVSIPLVVGAALFLRTVQNLAAIPLGFDPEGLVEFQVDPGYTKLPAEQYPRLYEEILARLREIPGVRSATLMENPLMSGIISNTMVTVDGARHSLYQDAVGPDFLKTMGMQLVAGRAPGIRDGLDAPPVGAVNEAAVKELFGGASPIGRMLHVGGKDVRIVGVVNDVPYRTRRDPVPPTLYPSALQRNGWGGHHVVLRTDVGLGRLERAVREAVYQVNSDLPVPELRTQAELMAQSSAKVHEFTLLLSIFGAFALLLASIGLHGVTAYSVTRRTSEIGVRTAVGARPGQILWLVLRQVVVLAGIGLLVGVPGSLVAGRLVRSLLYGVAPTDPRAVVSAATLMLAVALSAGLLPAWRAARMDALRALKVE